MNISKCSCKKHIDGPVKGLGEVHILLKYLTSEHFKTNRNNFNTITKLSGRYYFSKIDIYKYFDNIKV